MENIKGFAKPLVVFGVLAMLLLLQPDLGTVIVMFVTTFGLLFLAGAKIMAVYRGCECWGRCAIIARHF